MHMSHEDHAQAVDTVIINNSLQVASLASLAQLAQLLPPRNPVLDSSLRRAAAPHAIASIRFNCC